MHPKKKEKQTNNPMLNTVTKIKRMIK